MEEVLASHHFIKVISTSKDQNKILRDITSMYLKFQNTLLFLYNALFGVHKYELRKFSHFVRLTFRIMRVNNNNRNVFIMQKVKIT